MSCSRPFGERYAKNQTASAKICQCFLHLGAIKFTTIFLDAIASLLLQIPSQYTTFHYLVTKHIRADIEEFSLHNSDADWANLERTERHISAN